MWVIGRAAARPGTSGMVARVPRFRNTRSPRKLPPPAVVQFDIDRPITGKARPAHEQLGPLARYRPRCTSIRPSTIARFLACTPFMLVAADSRSTPNLAARRVNERTLAD